jgi:hypothetical protein
MDQGFVRMSVLVVERDIWSGREPPLAAWIDLAARLLAATAEVNPAPFVSRTRG